MASLARKTWLIWVIFAVVIAVMVLLASSPRTVTGAYRSGSLNWLAGENIYGEGIHGYLYLPQAGILFLPFALLPHQLGEILWRAFGIALLAAAVWRLARLQGEQQAPLFFLVMTLFTIPLAMNSARNGQMNIVLAALMAHAGIDLAHRQWTPAALWLTLGVALKPLMISMFLLCGVLYRPLRRRLLLAFALLLLAPFLTQNPAYVGSQYLLFFEKMQLAGNPGNEPYSDLFGITRSLGLHVPVPWQTVLRGAAALLTLAMCWVGLRRWGHQAGSLLLLTYTAGYILLFNPRTENNTYVLLAIPLGFFAAHAFLVARRLPLGALLAALTVFMSASYELTRGHNYWLNPVSCLLFLACVTFLMSRKPATPGDPLAMTSTMQPPFYPPSHTKP